MVDVFAYAWMGRMGGMSGILSGAGVSCRFSLVVAYHATNMVPLRGGGNP